MGKQPGLLSSGVRYAGFFFLRREHHEIPLILQTCVDEVERRGLSEVGIYLVYSWSAERYTRTEKGFRYRYDSS